jgi:ribosomal protein S18 acetylase RimI-like enzyme
MSTAPIAVRQATEADADTIGALHVRAWQWAYRGLLPDPYLDGLADQVEQRAAMWRRQIHPSERESGRRVWVAERDGMLAGFCSTSGTQGGGEEPGAHVVHAAAELHTIYLEPEVVGTGAGAALMRHALSDLRNRGFRSAVLWVQDTNTRARRFYEKGGWCPDGAEKTADVWGMPVRQVRYRINLD